MRLKVQSLVSDSPHLEYKDLCPVAYADEAVGQHTQTGVIAEHCTEPLLHELWREGGCTGIQIMLAAWKGVYIQPCSQTPMPLVLSLAV